LPGIDPDQEQWIRQAMKDDWVINFPCKFQVRAINNIAFCCGWLVYIIAKTGLGKSAIHLNVGSLQTGITLMMVSLIGEITLSKLITWTNNTGCLAKISASNYYHFIPSRPITYQFSCTHLLNPYKWVVLGTDV
jgi:hypothetical protein